MLGDRDLSPDNIFGVRVIIGKSPIFSEKSADSLDFLEALLLLVVVVLDLVVLALLVLFVVLL